MQQRQTRRGLEQGKVGVIVERRGCLQRADIADHDPLRVFNAAGGKNGVKVHVRQQRLELAEREEVVGLVHVAVVLRVERGRGDRRLGVIERRDALRRLVRAKAGERQQRCEICGVGAPLRVGAVDVEVLIHARADERECGDSAARIREVGRQAEAEEHGQPQLLLHLRIDAHQLVERFGALDGIKVLLNGRDAGLLAALGVHHAVVERLDLRLGGAGSLFVRVDLADERRDLLVDRQTQTVERAVDG